MTLKISGDLSNLVYWTSVEIGNSILQVPAVPGSEGP